jgi:hypothetical protein
VLVPLQDFRINLDFNQDFMHSRTGSIGIAVLVPLSISISISYRKIDIVEQGLSISIRKLDIVEQYLYGSYLAEQVHMVTDANSRLCLRSASQMMLRVQATRRSTLGDRAFPVAAARAWNSLPPDVKSAPSVETFRRHLKTQLFNVSF